MEEVYGCCRAYTGTGHRFRAGNAESIGHRTGNAWKIRGGGISGLTEEAPEKATEETEKSEDRKTVQNQTLEAAENELKGDHPKKKTIKTSGDTAENGQIILDVSEGDVKITKTGVTVGGVSKDDGSLNPKGYWITGTTTKYNVIVEKGVRTEITLSDVDITCDKTKMDCINVSHATVTMTLKGNNTLLCKSGTAKDGYAGHEGNAITKDGMDGELIIQCEKANEKGHRCDSSCGSLTVAGQDDQYHAGAIGNSVRGTKIDGECGLANLIIKGGNIVAKGGYHSPGIGGACLTSYKFTHDAVYGSSSMPAANQKVSNLSISGGNIKAEGNYGCAGLGGGVWVNIDGLSITGGKVEAVGGSYGPGIGAVCTSSLDNIVISGGDTLVIAKGDENSNAPGIGATNYPGYTIPTKFGRFVSSPQEGYQGYVQDGDSMDSYTFMEGTPFKSETQIHVGKFYTVAYFGPFRDENTVESKTNEQIGANHIISKTGGNGFTKEQLKQFTKVTAKDKTGNDLPEGQIRFSDEKQIQELNEAKQAGKVGDYPLTFETSNGTKVTVNVCLRDDGTDAAGMDPGNPDPAIGANDFEKDTGGDAFTEEELKIYGEPKGKDKDGTTIDLDGFTVDTEQFEKINKAKTAGEAGVFELTYTSKAGAKVTVTVSLMKYDETGTSTDPDSKETIKGMNIISRTGGDGFTEEQLKDLSVVKAFDHDGRSVERERILFSEPDQIERINEAKKAGETGNFPLTMKAPGGAEVTVQVYLRDQGTDSAKSDPDHGKAFLAANNGTHPTGGEAFAKEELLELCRAKAKDQSKNTVEPSIDPKQWEVLNEAKTAGRTGEFSLTFFIEDGTKVQVKITLTGDHKVKFDSNGGYDTPVTQTVRGGNQVIEPKDPKRDGYEFMGWYYTDENGKEAKWNFSDPVHQNMTLRAKWKKAEIEKADKGTSGKENKKGTSEKNKNWKYKEIRKNEQTAKTGEESKTVWAVLGLLGGTGILCCLRKKRKIS
ncbi:MAG: InlB B-repeat-containing protein [Anaerostipes caccae]|uniref:InlB B-repeat-containing protein n=1 Tax=Anaerostipes caccae TaxID=105841 RepID=UPI00399FD89B